MEVVTTKKNLFRLFFCSLLLSGWGSTGLFAQINTFPYAYGFENEGVGPTGCNPSYTMVQTGWLNAAGDDMDWTTDQNATGSGNTGPNGPFAGNVYMYLETSCSANRTANLETPAFDFTSAPSPQVSFWYHMYGSAIGSLFFEASTNNGATWTVLWSLTGQQQTSSADPWLQAVVNTTGFGGQANVKFRFRGTSLSSNFTGDMAIDEFLVENILPDNAGIVAMTSPVPGAVAGSYPVDVTMENFGNNPLTSATIGWTLNGVPQTPVNFTGPAVAPFTSTTVNLSASTAFPSGLTTLRFWTSSPNGNADTDPNNDTLTTIFCTGLSGTYTVGTAASDFPTIPDAVNAMYSCGVGGPVIFQVQPGTYTGTILLDQPVSGASATNTITFDGGAQAATLDVASGTNIVLEQVDYITFQNFVITNGDANQGRGIWLSDQADYNRIIGNRIQMQVTNFFNTAAIVASASPTSPSGSGNNANFTLIQGNTISGSDRGISLWGQSTTDYNEGNEIRDNEIFNADNYGIYAYYQEDMIVSGNYIHDFPSTFHYGFFGVYGTDVEVTANDIRAEDQGIYYSQLNNRNAPATRALIANNMVQAATDRGLYLITSRETDVFHNTIVSGGTAVTFSNFDNTVDVRNNLFMSTSNQTFNYVFQTFTPDQFLDLDYNLLYAESPLLNLVDYDGTIYTDLLDWQTNNPDGYGQNSITGQPTFVAPGDLHLDGALADNRGILTRVVTDFDGDVRPAPTGAPAVDIGADEYTPPQNDAGVADLVSPTLPLVPGFSRVEINVRNYGTQVLSSFDVTWQIDNGTPINTTYTGAPIPVGGNANMILANVNLPAATTSLIFWTSNPNGVMDERMSNDTLEVDICPGLAGVYTVGHPTADFPTLGQALEALRDCGVGGPVLMELLPGTYTGGIKINEIAGASAANTVVFDGLDPTAVTLTHDGTGDDSTATIALDGADYITFRNMTIENTGSGTAFGVLLTDGADHNVIEENIISLPIVTSGGNVVGVLSSASYTTSIGTATEGNNTNYTTIQNNEIIGGVTGVLLEGGTNNFENIGNAIIGNDLHDQYNFGIFVDEQDSIMINKNSIDNMGATGADAMQLNDVQNYSVMGNRIVARDYGIAIFGGFGIGDECRNGRVVNNMIECPSSGEGLYMRNINVAFVYHNSIAAGRVVWLDNQNNIDFRNNIMAANTNGTCFYTFDPVTMTGMDNNLFYLQGTNADAVRFGTTTYNTLADWQTNGPAGYDANSITGNPNFVNGLFLGGALAIDGGDPNLNFPVNVDITDDMRPQGAAPDIGADETEIRPIDAMAIDVVAPTGCGQAAHDVVVRIANVGSNLLVSVPVTVNVTGDATATFNFTQPVFAPGVTLDVPMGNINTEAGGTYNIELIVNAANDANRMNDTIRKVLTIVPSNTFALSMASDSIVCVGKTAQVLTSASYSPATILWYDAPTGGNLIQVGNGFTTMPLSADVTYYAAVQGCNSARAPSTVRVDNIGISVDLGPDVTICGGSATELIPTITNATATSIVWSDGAQTNLLEVTTSGQYSVTVMNANGCEASDTIDVTATPAPSVVPALTNVTCGGAADGAIDLTVSSGVGPFSYAWSDAAGSTTEDISGLNGGFYAVTITDNGTASNCTYVETFQINEPTTLFANVNGTTTSCDGTDGSVDLNVNGGTTPYTYLWSDANGSTTEDLSNAAGGTFTVTVTDANGCQSTATATVAAPTPITVSVDSIYPEILAIQGGIDITASGGTGNFQYSWNTGATTDDVTGLVAGTYTVTVTDLTTGCQVIIDNIVVPYQLPDMVDELPNVSRFELFPNPTNGQVWINLELGVAQTVELSILSVTGQVLQQFEPNEQTVQTYSVDMSQYPAGVYLARFIVGRQVRTVKVIVE